MMNDDVINCVRMMERVVVVVFVFVVSSYYNVMYGNVMEYFEFEFIVLLDKIFVFRVSCSF